MKLTRTHDGFRVLTVPDRKLEGFEGLNAYAAKRFGVKHYPGRDVVEVDAKYKGEQRERIIKHEVKEAELMRKGVSYWRAHEAALKAERLPWKKVMR